MRDKEYIKQVVWGTSLKMAKDEEIKECYNIIKDYMKGLSEMLGICEQAKLKKVEPKRSLFGGAFSAAASTAWLCGMMYSGSDLCNKEPSVSAENLQKALEILVPDEKNINAQNIIDAFVDSGYIAVYPCKRLFFIK